MASATIASVAHGKRAAPEAEGEAQTSGLCWRCWLSASRLSVVAWGYLVWAAIDFGAEARGGNGDAWKFLALASLGAVACLFLPA